jgi:hypothetical protein
MSRKPKAWWLERKAWAAVNGQDEREGQVWTPKKNALDMMAWRKDEYHMDIQEPA